MQKGTSLTPYLAKVRSLHIGQFQSFSLRTGPKIHQLPKALRLPALQAFEMLRHDSWQFVTLKRLRNNCRNVSASRKGPLPGLEQNLWASAVSGIMCNRKQKLAIIKTTKWKLVPKSLVRTYAIVRHGPSQPTTGPLRAKMASARSVSSFHHPHLLTISLRKSALQIQSLGFRHNCFAPLHKPEAINTTGRSWGGQVAAQWAEAQAAKHTTTRSLSLIQTSWEMSRESGSMKAKLKWFWVQLAQCQHGLVGQLRGLIVNFSASASTGFPHALTSSVLLDAFSAIKSGSWHGYIADLQELALTCPRLLC